jgi:hypothetical protein
MHTWPAWNLENAPPPLDGARDGSHYRTDYPKPVVEAPRAPVARPAPAPQVRPVVNTPQIAEQPPVEEQATLPATERPDSGEATLAAIPRLEEPAPPMPVEPAPPGPSDTAPIPAVEPAQVTSDNTAAIDATPIDTAPKLVSPANQPAMIEAPPQVDAAAPKEQHEVKLERQDGAIILEFSDSESNLPAVVEGPSVVSGIAKHLALMSGTIFPYNRCLTEFLNVGIGAAIGGAMGVGWIAMKHFRVWPFNRSPKTENGETKSRRNHARDWEQTEVQLTREDFD